jgi:peptide/nickel transport system substrate-binding protein
VSYFAALDRAITKYSYDPRRADQLLAEGGYTKGADGIYASPSDGRFAMEVAVAQGPRNDTEVQVMADGLKRQGLDTSIRIIPRVQITDPYVLANFPGILIGSHNRAVIPPLTRFRISEIARPETRGRGNNYSGWTNPEGDRLVSAYETALDPNDRNQRLIDLLKLVSDEVPIYPLYYNLEFMAHASSLRGPMVVVLSDATTWNVHEWFWAQ